MLLNPEVRQQYLNYERLLTSAGVCFLHNEHIFSRFGELILYFMDWNFQSNIIINRILRHWSLTALEELIGTPSKVGDTYSSGT